MLVAGMTKTAVKNPEMRWVYFVQPDGHRCGSTAPKYVIITNRLIDAPVKIGCTSSLERRLESLCAKYRRPMRFVGALPGGYELERELHLRFQATRVVEPGIGLEWFFPSSGLADFVRALPPHGLTGAELGLVPPRYRAEWKRALWREWRARLALARSAATRASFDGARAARIARRLRSDPCLAYGRQTTHGPWFDEQ